MQLDDLVRAGPYYYMANTLFNGYIIVRPMCFEVKPFAKRLPPRANPQQNDYFLC